MTTHKVPIYCENMSAINISKNLVQYSRTKHIEIKQHLIRDHMLKEDIEIDFVDTLHQLAYIFTNPLNEEQFYKIRRDLAIIDANELLSLQN
ncbi:Uncharacterized protein TCM_033743 [Theobroma cacao]|uniref:Cysteine-rich RLK (RECEPTOR-like protein kinase) 8 n=1 Tax=Theobroma cacao TaxID=3641 RepID=A0A061FAH4_THECC|nr:Uncharacterized protein TCM_033743 [Theobroma cacao]